jgi:hypothetical protein
MSITRETNAFISLHARDALNRCAGRTPCCSSGCLPSQLPSRQLHDELSSACTMKHDFSSNILFFSVF